MLPLLLLLVPSELVASMALPRPHLDTVPPPLPQDMVQPQPPLVLRRRLWDPFPPHQATAPLQQAAQQRLPPVRPMLDLTARTDLLGPRDVIRGTLTYLYKQAPIFLPLYLCKHTPNYPTTPTSLPTQPTNFHLGLSSSSRTLAKRSRASLCLARSAPPQLSRFATPCLKHVAPRCLASVAAR